jgi:hypothetical protein
MKPAYGHVFFFAFYIQLLSTQAGTTKQISVNAESAEMANIFSNTQRMISNCLLSTPKFGKVLLVPRLNAINEPIMDNRTACQQKTGAFNKMLAITMGSGLTL